jgi:predicted NBD/HSP70 family sugar kinase
MLVPPGRSRATVRDVRRTNRSSVLRTLFLQGEGSRAALAAATGLSAASMTNVVGELVDEGLVIEAGVEESDGGRPRTLVRINPGFGAVIGVDVGETRTRVEAFDMSMGQLAAASLALDPSHHEPDVVAARVAEGLAKVVADCDLAGIPVLGIGLGVPGVVSQDSQLLVHAPAFGWAGVPIRQLLAKHTALPVFVDNGAKTMGQAEMWFGAGRGARNAVVALLGTGVGAAVVIDGSVYRGASASAGEWGHTTIVVGGRRCRCGGAGCLEAYVGATAILDRWATVRRRRRDDSLDTETALADLVHAARSSSAAAQVLEETAQYLGVGIATLVNLLNPECVVLGGWAGQALGPALLDQIETAMHATALDFPARRTSLRLGQLGTDAIALGAATLVVEDLLNAGGRTEPVTAISAPTPLAR